jgi:glycosyltransferase involved in cell wall biosynthesis
MVKAADALVDAGYDVRVVSTMPTRNGSDVDHRLHARRRWRWTPIRSGRDAAPVRWFVSGIRAVLAARATSAFGGRIPRGVAVRAYSRMHTELLDAILAEPADLVYAGTNGAIAAALDASERAGIPCGIDFEDFHCAELEPDGTGARTNELAAFVMADAVRRAAFLTAGSLGIADACAERFGRRPVAINNVFPLPPAPSLQRGDGPLRLYWFSQTIGPNRGVEDLIDAAARASVRCELHLRGTVSAAYAGALQRRAGNAPAVTIAYHPLAEPDDMVGTCAGFDAGLSAEQAHVLNRAINLPNKALTYPLAGLALILTNTRGQRPLLDTLHGEAIVYEPADTASLADGLRRWALDAAMLRRAREASWEAARSRWHWEHPQERDTLLATIGSV